LVNQGCQLCPALLVQAQTHGQRVCD
jgi:hypothetical protein